MRYYLIMLAAGFSRRFGSNKLLHEIDGKPMYRHTFEKLQKVSEDPRVAGVIVVSQYPVIEENAKQMGFHPVHNDHSEQGIASSLVLGLETALELEATLQLETAGESEKDSRSEEPVAYMYLVGDQPYLRPETILSMLNKYEAESCRILCLFADGKRGNPVLFGSEFAPELLALTGDTGGKQVIKKHPEALTTMVVDGRELVDVDERE